MAKFTVEQWRCDRCGKVADRWLKPGSAYSIRGFVDYGTAGGPVFDWNEMCVPCNDEIGKAIEQMKQSAKLDQQRVQAAILAPGDPQ